MAEHDDPLRRSGKTAAATFQTAHGLTKITALFFASREQHARCAFMLLSSWTFQEAGRVASQPENPTPDEDFAHTTLRRRRVTGERALPWAPDPLTQHALASAVSADEAHAALSAQQRALARLHGAEQHKDNPAGRRRRKEAVEHAQAASTALKALAHASLALQAELQALPLPSEAPPAVTLRTDELPTDVLAILYLAGLPIQALEPLLNTQTPNEMNPRTLDHAAAHARNLGRALAKWTL